MIINGIGRLLEKYKFENKLNFPDIEKKIGLSKRTIQTLIETDNVVKTDTFFKLFRLLNLDIEEYYKSETMTQQINNVTQNNGTLQNVINGDTKTIEALERENQLLKARITDLETIIELMKK